MTCLSLNALALRQARRDRQLVSKRLLLNEDEEQPAVSMDTAPGGHVSIRYCVGSGVSSTRISHVPEFSNLAHLKAGRCKGGNQLIGYVFRSFTSFTADKDLLRGHSR